MKRFQEIDKTETISYHDEKIIYNWEECWEIDETNDKI